jgi:DNA-directed RNA polymerase specialized sigma24 family protein
MDKSAQWLAKVAERHTEWVNVIKGFGEYEYCDDLVQETYLILYKYANEEKVIKDGVVSRGYMYFTLRSTYFQFYKNKRKIKKVSLDNEEYTQEVEYIDSLDEEVAYNKICTMIDEHIEDWRWYERRLFQLYRDSGLSIRGIAKETNISWVSIFNTLKNAKHELKQKFQEDYDDFVNNDFEQLK